MLPRAELLVPATGAAATTRTESVEVFGRLDDLGAEVGAEVDEARHLRVAGDHHAGAVAGRRVAVDLGALRGSGR